MYYCTHQLTLSYSHAGILKWTGIAFAPSSRHSITHWLCINHFFTVTVTHMTLSHSHPSTQSQCTVPSYPVHTTQAFCNALVMHLLCQAGRLSRTGYALVTLPRSYSLIHCHAGILNLSYIHSNSYILDYFLRSKIILHSLCHSPRVGISWSDYQLSLTGVSSQSSIGRLG